MLLNRIFSSRSLLAAKSAAANASFITRTFKSDLKIKWLRPTKLPTLHPSRSGDCASYTGYDKTKLALEFQHSEALKSADEIVKKQFSLEFQPMLKVRESYQQEIMDKVKRHCLDTGSIESEIAQMTARIRYLQNVVNTSKCRGKILVFTKQLIDRRYMVLRRLRNWDYKRFEWILEKLDIEFKPRPQHFIMIARKEGLRRLTHAHCDDVRNTRLTEYHKQLKAEQLPFLSEKLKNMEFIRNEQLELGVEVTITQKDVDDVRQKYEAAKAEFIETATPTDDESTKKWKIY